VNENHDGQGPIAVNDRSGSPNVQEQTVFVLIRKLNVDYGFSRVLRTREAKPSSVQEGEGLVVELRRLPSVKSRGWHRVRDAQEGRDVHAQSVIANEGLVYAKNLTEFSINHSSVRKSGDERKAYESEQNSKKRKEKKEQIP